MSNSVPTPHLQRITILVASMIGLACCVLAVLDARSQQADDIATLRPALANRAGRDQAHHLRSPLSHAPLSPAPSQRVDGEGRVLG